MNDEWNHTYLHLRVHLGGARLSWRYGDAGGAAGVGFSNLSQRGSSGRVDGAVGHPVVV